MVVPLTLDSKDDYESEDGKTELRSLSHFTKLFKQVACMCHLLGTISKQCAIRYILTGKLAGCAAVGARSKTYYAL